MLFLQRGAVTMAIFATGIALSITSSTMVLFDTQRRWQPLESMVMVAGLLFTTLLYLYLIRAVHRTYSIEELVQKRTAELVEANAELEREVNERQRSEELLLLQSRCSALDADVGISLTQNQTLQNMLQECAEVLVRHLDGALARIWTLNIEENVLELQASAGMYTHINGVHGRIPVGQFKIGLIAQNRQPHLTNQVIGDPRIHDQAWAAHSGLVAFAGYPLMVDEKVVGVMAMFARLPLPEVTLKAMGSAANAISLGIKRQQAESELRQSSAKLRRQATQLEQALHELKLAQAQLIQTEKMSSLGQMVAGVAHEINNPVNFIYGNLDYANNYVQDLLGLVHLYQQHYPNPNQAIQNQIAVVELDFLTEDLPKVMDSMKIGAERIRGIVLSLRNFSRLDEAEMKPVNIHLGIDSTLLILNSQLKQGIEVVQHYGDLPLVECYPAQLNQVFMNILSNAIDALQTQAERPSKQIVIQTTIVDFNQVQVKIRDNGPGILPQLINKLFDPFFTTKPVGKGTGLGLSISYQIIEKHRGKIEVNSQPTQETEFVITLPVKQLL